MNLILNIYKPLGITSNDLVQDIKKKLHLKKIGHAGTLDPMAEGVMVIATNNMTKKLNELSLNNKEYIAEIEFGKTTDTYDSTGNVTSEDMAKNIEINKIDNYIKHLIEHGYNQYPPIYSSVKVKGKKLYEYARKNEDVNIEPRNVKIINYEIISFIDNILKIKIEVSKGFYVRSFANDLGKVVGCGAYLKSLIRTKSGVFKIDDSLKLDDILTISNKCVNLNNITEALSIDELVIGHFDILHKGYNNFLSRNNISILTFYNNPSKNTDFYSFNNRIRNLINIGIKNIFFIDLKKNNYSKNEFISILKSKLNPKKIIVGENFVFGKNREGNISDLFNNFNVEVVKINNISNSLIKKYIYQCDFNMVNSLVNNYIYINGIVCHGKKIGRQIGFPTANIFFESNCDLNEGVYKTETIIGNVKHDSISFLKKVRKGLFLLETYIINFSSNLYGKFITVNIISFIRKPKKVSSINELKLIIENDVKNIYK